jgi:hypothetical protein
MIPTVSSPSVYSSSTQFSLLPVLVYSLHSLVYVLVHALCYLPLHVDRRYCQLTHVHLQDKSAVDDR